MEKDSAKKMKKAFETIIKLCKESDGKCRNCPACYEVNACWIASFVSGLTPKDWRF